MSAPTASGPAAAAPLAPREAYRRWAPGYARETAVSRLEESVARRLSPAVEGRRLLDAGCGTGRRLPRSGAALSVGIDLTPEMLATGRGGRRLAAADVRRLPFRDGTFDLVWCRLVLGHLPDLATAYAELGRVCGPGGAVLVSDFHPAAAAAGHRRTFRDQAGALVEIEHHVHAAAAHAAAAERAGLEPLDTVEGRVGPEVRGFYARAGRLDRYAQQLGLPLVLALLLRRRGPP